MTDKINDGGPAFPTEPNTQPGFYLHQGMSLRDHFASHIACGMAAFSGTSGISFGPRDIAGRAYEVADAMLAARKASS